MCCLFTLKNEWWVDFLSLGPVTRLSMESYTSLDEKTLNWELNEASKSVVNSNSLGDCGHTSVSLSSPVIANNTNSSLASQGSRGWENQMDKNLPGSCALGEEVMLCLLTPVSFSMRGQHHMTFLLMQLLSLFSSRL